MDEALPPYTAAQLGPERALAALALRKRLGAAGLRPPRWVDERPGRLQVVIGDCAGDPPLGRSAAELARQHGPLLLQGLGALQLAAAAPRAALVARRGEVAALELLCRGTRVEVHEATAAWPSQPDLDVPGAAGLSWVVPAQGLARAGAALTGQAAPLVCTVAGAVRAPQVVTLSPGETPRQLVRRCGGAKVPAWVAVEGGAPAGRLLDADEAIGEGAEMVLVLPVEHELLYALRRPLSEPLALARSVCLGCRLCTEGCPEDLRGARVAPHQLIAMLGRGVEAGDPAFQTALACTGCGVCDVLCPHGLSPRRLTQAIRAALPGPGTDAGARDKALPPLPPPEAALRRLPLDLVVARLGLSPYVLPD